MSTNVLPPSTDVHAHDMLRVYVGEFVSGARTSCQFSLCAVAKMLPYRSTTRLGSYPKPRSGVTFTGAPNGVGPAPDAVTATSAATTAARIAATKAVFRRMGSLLLASGRQSFLPSSSFPTGETRQTD